MEKDNYIQVNTSNFGAILSASDNNIQQALETLDDHSHASGGHNPLTIGTANGLSLLVQVLSLGKASAGVTGALDGTDWTTFNNKGDVYLASANEFTAKQIIKSLNTAGLNESLKLWGGAASIGSGPSIGLYDWWGAGGFPTWRLAEIGASYIGGGAGWAGELVFNINPGTTATSYFEALRIGRDGLATFNGSMFVDGSQDTIQLKVQGYSTQTNVLQVWEQSSGTPVATLSNKGEITNNITDTLTSGSLLGVQSNIAFTPSGSSSALIKGFIANVESLGAQNITGLTAGLQGFARHSGSGTLSSSYGLLFTAENNSTGTITSLYGILVSTANNNAGGNVGTMYGINILAPTNTGTTTTAYGLFIGNVAGAGTNYSIYTGTGKVRFGDVVLPVQAPTASAPTYVKGGIYFDTTLNKLRVGGATVWETITSV